MQMPTAIALLNARLHKSLRAANESASSLVRVAMVVNAQDATAESMTTGKDGSLTALMEKVVAEATARFHADRCSMYVADHVKGEIWSLVAMALAYLHPLVQEGVNQAHLEPKLERARALQGETVDRLYAELGVPTQVVAASHGRAGSYGYATFGPAWWAPLAQSEVVVPLSEDGMRVSMIAHLAD